MTPEDARGLAEELLAGPLPQRWAHSLGVGRQAVSLRPLLGNDADLLLSAALLHDIGYAPDLADTGFHPVDGARYLRSLGTDERVVRLVAHHSFSDREAADRELTVELAEFAHEHEDLVDALTWCDMTTNPRGQRVTFDERLAEIHSRYGPDSLVTRSAAAATPGLRASIERVEWRLTAAAQPA